MAAKNSPARRVAYAGLLTALSVVLLLAVRTFPYFNLSALFVLSLLPVALAAERRWADAGLSFMATSLLGAAVVGFQDVWLFYTAFFGWYGIAREFVWQRLGRVWVWVIMAVLFNVVLFALYFSARELLLNVRWPVQLLIPGAEVAFVAFEVLFGLCREYYMKHIRRFLYPNT